MFYPVSKVKKRTGEKQQGRTPVVRLRPRRYSSSRSSTAMHRGWSPITPIVQLDDRFGPLFYRRAQNQSRESKYHSY